MRQQIELLTSLQRVDREIKEKASTRDMLAGEVQKKEREIEAGRSALSALRSEWAEKDKLKQEKERLLQEEGRKAMDKRMRMNRIKNIRELQALQREIDQLKQANSQLEEELVQLLEETEGRAATLREKEEELKTLEEEWARQRRDIEAQIADLDRAIAEASAGRRAITDRLNGDLVGRYELIFSRRGGVAVVTVSDGICQGCFRSIPPQLHNEILKSDKLNVCPSCHRILYSQPSAPDDKQL